MCEWRKEHAPKGNPSPLDICQDPQLPLATVRTQVEQWWAYWHQHLASDVYYPLETDFEAAWSHGGGKQFYASEEKREEEAAAERVRAVDEKWAARELKAKQAEAEAKQAEAERERQERAAAAQRAAAMQKQFEQKAGSLSNDELCLAYSAKHYRSAREELDKRQAISPAEWNLIEQRHIAIGMSEAALLCSWGRAPANRTITATSVRKQYVYGSTLVYLEDGRVTALQDRQ